MFVPVKLPIFLEEFSEWEEVRLYHDERSHLFYQSEKRSHVCEVCWSRIALDGLNVVREQGCTDKSAGCGYNDNCEDKDSITRKWACGKDV